PHDVHTRHAVRRDGDSRAASALGGRPRRWAGRVLRDVARQLRATDRDPPRPQGEAPRELRAPPAPARAQVDRGSPGPERLTMASPLRPIAILTAAAVAIFAALAPHATAATACAPKVATVASVQGTVEVTRAGATDASPLVRDDVLCAGDTVRVGAKSRADVVQLDQTLLRLAANTAIT